MKSGIADVRWIDLPAVTDGRGTLTAIEATQDIPFAIERIFYMHHISADRGGHAHRDTDQVLPTIATRWQPGDRVQILYIAEESYDSVIISTA